MDLPVCLPKRGSGKRFATPVCTTRQALADMSFFILRPSLLHFTFYFRNSNQMGELDNQMLWKIKRYHFPGLCFFTKFAICSGYPGRSGAFVLYGCCCIMHYTVVIIRAGIFSYEQKQAGH
ncbi:hypothetical protein A8C56_01460 [Niabella ginsenosidivorans]|uniref:Uncharacterized protein n=1 Tax=Niabella ginsenosidivorans TaxID=1176587 RepID=A0A1A9HWQ8_9BACT|nr:hypothetical protein A8C56_01460 [Niabella ginsenosidivorans]